MGKKQLDAADRMTLQGCLEMKQPIRQIALRLGFDPATVYRELSRNSRKVPGNSNPCLCRDRFIVCNMCPIKGHCPREKLYYDFAYTVDVSDRRKRLSRSSPKLAQNLIALVDAEVSAGVVLGQSLHHIYASSKHLKSICSEATVRRLCYRGSLSVRPSQLRKYVVYRRHTSSDERFHLKSIKALVGRTYKDYKRAVASHKTANVVQYDSVIGKFDDRRAILTIAFPKYGFQFGRLIEKGSSASANAACSRSIYATTGSNSPPFSGSRPTNAGKSFAPPSSPTPTGPPTRPNANASTSSSATSSQKERASMALPKTRLTTCSRTSIPTSGNRWVINAPMIWSAIDSERLFWTKSESRGFQRKRLDYSK